MSRRRSLLRAGPLTRGARGRQPPLHPSSRPRDAARRVLHRARPELGHLPAARSSNLEVRQAVGRHVLGLLRRGRGRRDARSFATGAIIEGDGRRPACSSRPRARPSRTSSPTAPASSCFIPSRAWRAEPATVEHVDGRIVETRIPGPDRSGAADDGSARADPRVRTGLQGHLPDGGRHVRDGGPAQLDRRLLQDLCAAARAAVALHACRPASSSASV